MAARYKMPKANPSVLTADQLPSDAQDITAAQLPADAVDVQAQAQGQPQGSSLWQTLNTPVADIFGGQGTTERIMSSGRDLQAESDKTHMKALSRIGGNPNASLDVAAKLRQMKANGATTQQLTDEARKATAAQSGMRRTWAEALDTAGPQIDKSTINTLAPFTSPVGLAMQTAGKIGRIGKVAAGMAGAAFGVQGAKEMIGNSDHWYSPVVDPVQNTFFGLGIADNPASTPEQQEGQLIGESMLASAPHSIKSAGEGIRSFKGSLASRIAPDTGGMTRGEIYARQRNAGIKPDLAAAGGGRFSRWIKDKTGHNPGGAGRWAKIEEQQRAQTQNAMTNAENAVDPTGAGKDLVGISTQTQDGLANAKDVMHQNAAAQFRQTLGDLVYTTADTADIAQKARELKQQLQTGQITSLQPKEMIALLDEIEANYGDTHNNRSMIDDLFRDRSRLMKAQFSDATVAGEGESAARQMAKVMRDSLEKAAKNQVVQHTGGSSTTVDRSAEFNKAMQDWGDYHDMFGDRRSPLVQAMNEPDPVKVLDRFIGNKGSYRGVEMLKKVAPEFVAVLKREFIKRLYDTNDTGVRENFGNMQNRLLHYNENFVKALFSPEELRQMRALAAGGKSMNLDINPSGSGRYAGQTASAIAIGSGLTGGGLAAAMGHPVAGALAAGTALALPAANWAGSRLLTSTPLTDFLMGYDKNAGQSRGSLASRTPQASTQPQGRAISNPFGGTFRRRGVSGRQAGTTVGGGPIGWLLDALMNAGASKKEIGGVKKKAQTIAKALEPRSLDKTAAAVAGEHNNFVDTVGEGTWGGSTYHLADGNMSGKDAFAVSVFPELQQKVDGVKVTPDQVKQFISRPEVQEVLKSDPRISVGTWASDGQTYLDLVATPSHMGEARRLGAMYDQKAIFDLQNMREINTGGTGEGKVPENAPAPIDRLKDVKEPDYVDAIHYANADNISELNPSFYGQNKTHDVTGLPVNRPDMTRKQAFPKWWADETYLGREDAPAFREVGGERFGARQYRYNARMNASRIYDFNADPEGLMEATKPEMNRLMYGESRPAMEAYAMKLARDRGYSGRYDVNGLIASWDKVPVERDIIPPWADVQLRPEERAGLKTEYQKRQFVKALENMPELQEWVDSARAGEIGRKWYERSNKAFDALMEEAPDYFGEGDRKRWGDFVAALSPQQGVFQNLREALSTWKEWSDGNKRMKIEPRTTDPAKLRKLLDRNLTMAGSKVGNAIKALTGQDMYPDLQKNMFFKVPNFGRNLNNLMKAVTNDSWMGLFSGLTERQVPKPEFYHPISVMTRAAAKKLGWQPAEAQAAIWVFTRTLAEQSGWKGNAKRIAPREALEGLTDDKMKQYADDFADIMRNDGEARTLLKKLGVNLDVLDQKLEALGHPEVRAGIGNTPKDRLVGVADRIERARTALDEGTAQPVKGEVSPEDTSFSFGGETQRERPKLRLKR